MIIIDQRKLADVLHDADFRFYFTQAVEHDENCNDPERTALYEFLVRTGLAVNVPARLPRPVVLEEPADE